MQSDEPTIVVTANAGAAKTTTLAFRIAEGLRRGIEPAHILALTFTEPAEQALRRALLKVGVPAAVSDGLWIDTFEDFARRMLQRIEGTRYTDPGGAASATPREVPRLLQPETLAPWVWQAVEQLRQLQVEREDQGRGDDNLHLPDASQADSGFVERFLNQSRRLKGMLALESRLQAGERLSADLAIDLQCDYTLLRLQPVFEALRHPTHADQPQFRGPGDATYDLARRLADGEDPLHPDDIPGWPHRSAALMVDEMHDLNRAMFTVLKALLKPRSVYFCGVGDVDQVIHVADGAQREFMQEMSFARETGRPVQPMELTVTHRFGDSIARVAGRFARKPYRSKAGLSSQLTHLRYDEEARATPGAAAASGAGHTPADPLVGIAPPASPAALPSCHTQVAQLAAQWQSGKRRLADFAVLLRHPSQSVLIENALLEADIPYATRGFESYLMRPEVLLVRGLMAIAQRRFDAISDPNTRRRIVEQVVFFCGVTLSYQEDDRESPASRLQEAIRHVSLEPSTLMPFFEHQVLKNARRTVRPRLERALGILQAMPSASGFAAFLDALEIRRWAREVWIEEAQHDDAEAHLAGLREAAARSSPEAFFARLNAFELKHQGYKRRAANAVTLASIPSVKGWEFAQVVIPGLAQGQFPRVGRHIDASRSDERALFYVAVTRAREGLTLLSSRERPSPFIDEVRAELG